MFSEKYLVFRQRFYEVSESAWAHQKIKSMKPTKTKNKRKKKIKVTRAIALRNKSYSIASPGQVAQMAIALKNFIIKNSLSVKIVDRDYVMVEGWQFAGSVMGLFPKIIKVECISPGKWMAEAVIIERKTGNVISTGFAICSKDEAKKRTFDEFAILSMAQTRAIGKAFRNLIGWVVKLAGYEGTPAEEMKKVSEQPKEPLTEIKGDGKVGNLMAGENEKEKIRVLGKQLGLDTISKTEKATGLKVDFNAMTKVQASKVYAELLQIKISKK